MPPSTATLQLAKPAAMVGAYLPSVSRTDADVQATMSASLTRLAGYPAT